MGRTECIAFSLLFCEMFIAIACEHCVFEVFIFEEGDQIHSLPGIDLMVHINSKFRRVVLDDGGFGAENKRTVGSRKKGRGLGRKTAKLLEEGGVGFVQVELFGVAISENEDDQWSMRMVNADDNTYGV